MLPVLTVELEGRHHGNAGKPRGLTPFLLSPTSHAVSQRCLSQPHKHREQAWATQQDSRMLFVLKPRVWRQS